ncbi:hypothetical protein AAG747_27030 [Rapidithrix thailandica]|uniref:Uncharacterized protein n=1 Tax=Rapidithrix thailandica TaxID=413964 RepID=A0AAW9SKD5_9BACT
MDEKIDDIFFRGLEGKHIEKPASYWEGINQNVLENSIPKPWWSSMNPYLVASVLLAIIAVIIWGVTEFSENTSQENPNNPVEKNAGDTLGISPDSVPVQKNSTDTLGEKATEEDVKRAVVLPENPKPPEENFIPEESIPVENTLTNSKPDTNQVNMIERSDSLLVEINQAKDSLTRSQPDNSLNTSEPVNDSVSIENKIKSDSVMNKRPVQVIIIQDTIIVTDTVKVESKKK